MSEDCPETDIEFDTSRFTSAQKLRRAECFCSRATLDDLLSDKVMAPVLRSAGYEPDEFREMMTEMARNLVTPSEGGKSGASLLTEELLSNQIKHKLFGCLSNQLLSNFVKFIMSVVEYYLDS